MGNHIQSDMSTPCPCVGLADTEAKKADTEAKKADTENDLKRGGGGTVGVLGVYF